MIKVKVGKGKGDIEKALKIFKNKIRKTKLIEEIRNRQEFIKPSVKKRNKKRKAIYIDQKYRQNED
jgi:small subunit ribosomal protein S21